MKFKRSAIAIGAALAFTCHFASAQTATPTVTVTQQGNGNTSYAEQVSSLTALQEATATITQIGDNNHVGGPGATTGGIFQRAPNVGTSALVVQNGAGNNAGITQDGTIGQAGPVEARITQIGNANTATITQEIVTASTATVDQTGTGNVAVLEQSAADARLATTQNGTGNRVTVVQLGGPFGGPDVTQNGDGNTASVNVTNAGGGSGPLIVQTGTANSVTAVQTDVFDSPARITQLGSGNRADTAQTGQFQTIDLTQNGSNNLASVTQVGDIFGGLPGNSTLINQVGNSNTAIVRQVGEGYVANVSQIGSGNYTNIYQH
jgi:hypothetical protein